MQAPESPEYLRYEARIKAWVLMCTRERCLCPSDSDQPPDSGNNLCGYISSPGTESGAPNDASQLPKLMRVAIDRNQRPAYERVAVEFQRCFGEELFRFCGIGKEPEILRLLLQQLMRMAPVDLRPLLGGVPIYNTGKHIERLGLAQDLPALCRAQGGKPDHFLKAFAWKSVGNVVAGEGLGVNMWALLVLASLLGTEDIHAKNTSKVAVALLSLIAGMAPRAATPGQRFPVRSFNDQTQNVEMVIVQARGQPEHFLRPLRDDKFAISGEYTYCPADDGRVPEDWLHNSHLLAAAKRFLFCEWREVPPTFLRGSYQVLAKRHYAILRQGSRDTSPALGSLYVDSKGAVIRYDSDGLGYRVDLGVMEWSDRLAALGFLVMPMVFRSGALVLIKRSLTQLGCLVPSGTRASLVDAGIDPASVQYVGNFDPIRMGYHALVERDTTVFMDAETVQERLIAPGTVIWIMPGTPTWQGLAEQNLFPRRRSGDVDNDICALRARLNIPTVFVSVQPFHSKQKGGAR